MNDVRRYSKMEIRIIPVWRDLVYHFNNIPLGLRGMVTTHADTGETEYPEMYPTDYGPPVLFSYSGLCTAVYESSKGERREVVI